MPAHDQLDRVRDDLARDERRLHALGAHRDAVGDRDRVHLDGRPAGLADPLLHPLGLLPQVEVARHDLDPRVRDADERLLEVVVAVADGAHHGPRPRAVRPVDEHARALPDVAHAREPSAVDESGLRNRARRAPLMRSEPFLISRACERGMPTRETQEETRVTAERRPARTGPKTRKPTGRAPVWALKIGSALFA